jgi:hypothetical protein
MTASILTGLATATLTLGRLVFVALAAVPPTDARLFLALASAAWIGLAGVDRETVAEDPNR